MCSVRTKVHPFQTCPALKVPDSRYPGRTVPVTIVASVHKKGRVDTDTEGYTALTSLCPAHLSRTSRVEVDTRGPQGAADDGTPPEWTDSLGFRDPGRTEVPRTEDRSGRKDLTVVVCDWEETRVQRVEEGE